MVEDNEKLEEQIKTLRKEMDDLLRARQEVGSVEELSERITAIEGSREDAFGWDSATPDASRSGDLMDVRKMPLSEETDFKVLPFDIEFGKPTANVTTDVATVTMQPCDEDGNSFASADTVTVYVANDRQTQDTSDRGWTTASILSFIRFSPWVDADPDIAGVLIGEHLITPSAYTFPARLLHEDVCSLGEYDQWEEVEPDDANPNTWQAGGEERTHTNTSESLWEANQGIALHVHATTGTIVWVHEEVGDEHRYAFDFQKLRGDGESHGTKAASAGVSSDAAEWIQVENDGRIVRGRHCTPGPCCYSIGTKEDCEYHFNYFELDELGHVRIIGAYETTGEPTWEEAGPNA